MLHPDWLFGLQHMILTESISSTSMETWEVVLISLVVGVLMIVTIAGNILVLASFRVERRLQTVSNHFLCSLAVADLVIGKFIHRPSNQTV